MAPIRGRLATGHRFRRTRTAPLCGPSAHALMMASRFGCDSKSGCDSKKAPEAFAWGLLQSAATARMGQPEPHRPLERHRKSSSRFAHQFATEGRSRAATDCDRRGFCCGIRRFLRGGSGISPAFDATDASAVLAICSTAVALTSPLLTPVVGAVAEGKTAAV